MWLITTFLWPIEKFNGSSEKRDGYFVAKRIDVAWRGNLIYLAYLLLAVHILTCIPTRVLYAGR